MSTPPNDSQPEEITAPKNVRYLEGRIAELAKAGNSTVAKLKSLVANLAVCQMLPPSAVKGGTGLKLRLGENLRGSWQQEKFLTLQIDAKASELVVLGGFGVRHCGSVGAHARADAKAQWMCSIR
ncbi:hypothetical protein VUN82_24190 [Micrococcaceae bacterium Sec5.1]